MVKLSTINQDKKNVNFNAELLLKNLTNKVLDGEQISKKDALELARIPLSEHHLLFDSANRIRIHFLGQKLDLCSIINAKSGGCSEDCKFCAQSAHYKTNIAKEPLIKEEEVISQAKELESSGVHRFSLVTSGKGIGNRDFSSIIKIYNKVKKETQVIKLCASHGIISYDKAIALKEAGVTTYHHNLETSKNFYSNICTTHHFDERIETINNAKAAGLNICSGGIIGLGETIEDRIDMALELRKLEVNSVPINILTPISGTPLENMVPLSHEEIIKTIAIFRFILPTAHIRYAGGRSLLGNAQALGLQAGISSILTGNYLTTAGSSIDEDKQLVSNLGFNIN